MIKFQTKGDWSKTYDFFQRGLHLFDASVLDDLGKDGVKALHDNTPEDTGKTADSWRYEIVKTDTGYKVNWLNDNVHNGVLIAIILQYGHATRGGTWVEGTDYINPAMLPIFEKMADKISK